MLREPLLQFLIYILIFSTAIGVMGYPISTNDEIGIDGGVSNTRIIVPQTKKSNFFRDFIATTFHEAVMIMKAAADICIERGVR